MCAVAKSYMRCDIMGEPFKQNGRMYVTIETPTGAMKNVRWYTDAEWSRMYPNEDISVAKANSRTILGFGEAGYITIYYGDTYKNLDWFKAEPECRYHKIWGWYTPSNEEASVVLPEGVETGILHWNDIVNEADDVDEVLALKAVNAIRYANEKSGQFVGEIGDRDTFVLTVTKVIPLEGYYGSSNMHIMKDDNDNTFVWTTAAKTLEVNSTYCLKGTIKDHKEYHGVNQTILTRCTLVKDK